MHIILFLFYWRKYTEHERLAGKYKAKFLQALRLDDILNTRQSLWGNETLKDVIHLTNELDLRGICLVSLY